MDISNWLKEWAVLLSAGATLLLAIAACWSIWQNYRSQKRERDIRRTIERTEEVQEWVLEICSLASSASPPGNEQERRNRAWQAEKIVFLRNSVKVEAKKLDSKFTSEEKLENIIDKLSAIVEEHKSHPEMLAGEKSGESISKQIVDNTNKAIGIISNIKDRL